MKGIKQTNYIYVSIILAIILAGIFKVILGAFFNIPVYGWRAVMLATIVFILLQYLFNKYGE